MGPNYGLFEAILLGAQGSLGQGLNWKTGYLLVTTLKVYYDIGNFNDLYKKNLNTNKSYFFASTLKNKFNYICILPFAVPVVFI